MSALLPLTPLILSILAAVDPLSAPVEPSPAAPELMAPAVPETTAPATSTPELAPLPTETSADAKTSTTPRPTRIRNAKEKHRTATKAKRGKKHKKRRSRRLRFTALGSVGVDVGWLQGLTTRPVHTPMLLAHGEISPGFANRRWDLRLPVQLQQRETFAAHLDETQGSAALRVENKPLAWLKWAAQGELHGALRLNWPDQYQPQADGSLQSTDRYSYYERRVGAQLTLHPMRGHWADLAYRYRLADYRQDPAFDPIAAPSHLVPSDNERHEIELFWRWVQRPVKVKLGAQAFTKTSFFYFSRDAHTGSTHAGAGGAPPNPLQQLRGIEPQAELTWRVIDKKLQLTIGYGLPLVEDPFQGYYSSVGHHPWLGISSEPRRQYQIGLKAETWLVRYGSNSYQAGPGHPPLTSGDRRVDRKLALTLEGSLPVVKHLRATAQVKYVLRDTNFPPYEPGVFPASRQYDIEWNYQNVAATVGLAYTW